MYNAPLHPADQFAKKNSWSMQLILWLWRVGDLYRIGDWNGTATADQTDTENSKLLTKNATCAC